MELEQPLAGGAIGFKTGEVRNNELIYSYAIFELPQGVLSGEWAISNPAQALSHANLYGVQTSAVPLPAPLVLLLSALFGLCAMRARKRA